MADDVVNDVGNPVLGHRDFATFLENEFNYSGDPHTEHSQNGFNYSGDPHTEHLENGFNFSEDQLTEHSKLGLFERQYLFRSAKNVLKRLRICRIRNCNFN